MSQLTDIIANLESSGSLNEGPSGGFLNYRYQQYPAFVSQYGNGAPGVENYANQMLAANPNATLGDFYSGYVLNSGNPANPPGIDALRNTSTPGALGSYDNLTSKYDPNTPLSSLLGGSPSNSASTGSGFSYNIPDTPGGYAGNQYPSPTEQTFGEGSQPFEPGFPSGDGSPTGIGAQGDSGGPLHSLSEETSTPSAGLDLAQFQVAGVNAPASIAGVNAPVSAGSANDPAAPQGQVQNMAKGSPIYITDPGLIGQNAANTISSATQQLGSDIQSSEGQVAAAGTSWLASIENSLGDWFVRGGFIVLGLLMLAGAFLFFYMERKDVPTLAPA